MYSWTQQQPLLKQEALDCREQCKKDAANAPGLGEGEGTRKMHCLGNLEHTWVLGTASPPNPANCSTRMEAQKAAGP